MENKYYTPSIEEFHVGFEFEINSASEEDEWLKCSLYTLTDSVFNVTYGADGVMKTIAVPDCIRVKSLDKEDIESLGFNPSADEPEEWFCNFKEDYSTQLYYDDKTREANQGIGITIFNNGDLAFNGYIKNKSELIKLLNQLGIK